MEPMQPKKVQPIEQELGANEPKMPVRQNSEPEYGYKSMEPPEPKHLGYLESYLNKEHKLIADENMAKIYEENGLKIPGNIMDEKEMYDTSTDRNPHPDQKWPEDTLRDFFLIYEYQDPTYLGFDTLIVSDESPLFNYDTGDLYGHINTAKKFLETYENIPGMSQRKEILDNFTYTISEIFGTTTGINNRNKRYYIEMIEGLDKLNNKMVKYGEDLITITLTEDVSLRTQYLAELYNNLLYDYKNKRQMIPENTLRFDMLIKIEDIRNFKIENPKYDPEKSPNTEVFVNDMAHTYMMYKLHDCNFDFSQSQTHEGSMSIGGFNQYNQGNMNNTKINIKYKSISKIIESALIDEHNVVHLNNQDLSTLIAEYDSFSGIIGDEQDYKYYGKLDKRESSKLPGTENNKKFSVDELSENEQESKSDFLKSKNYLNDFKKEKPKIFDKEDYKKILNTSVNQLKRAGLSKFNEIRGQLIGDIIKEVRTMTMLPDKLGNVYSTKFRQMSIENFTTGLGNSLFDQVADDFTDFSMEKTDIFKQNKKADDSYLGDVNDILSQTNTIRNKK